MISLENLELLNNRCDVVVASCSPQLLPSICWGMGGLVHEDRRSMTVWLQRDQAQQVLADIEATGLLSVVFEVPVRNLGLQVKGSDARTRPASAADAPHLATFVENMVREFAAVGHPEIFARTIFEHPIETLVAVECRISAAFDQTPGPGAGKPVPPSGPAKAAT